MRTSDFKQTIMLWATGMGVALTACGDNNANVCLTGSTQCGSVCVDVMEDQLNCGACGTACALGTSCVAGVCESAPFACPTGLTACGTTCKDTANDPDNCGTCGNECAPANACSAGVCDPKVWEVLAPIDTDPAFTDFTPAGQSYLYNVGGTTFESFSFPDTTNPMGLFATLASPPGSFDTYSGLAWVGTSIYGTVGTSVYAYNIADDSWTTPVDATLPVSVGDAQTTGDDSGYTYTTASDRSIVQFKIADASVVSFPGPLDLGTSEPRAAWDSLTKRVYLGDYDDPTGTFYAFNPADGAFASLAPFPGIGFSDAFCSDRKGHVFTASSDCGNPGGTSRFWVYTAKTDSWSELPSLPFSYGCSEACTVTADGWLYFADGDTFANYARIKL